MYVWLFSAFCSEETWGTEMFGNSARGTRVFINSGQIYAMATKIVFLSSLLFLQCELILQKKLM